MSIYDTFNKLTELTQLKKTKNGYSKFIQRGNLELFDYNHGFIYFEIYSYKEPEDANWHAHLSFETIDDGDLDGWQEFPTKEDADEYVKEIANNIFKDMISCPNVKDLNAMLLPYNIYLTSD